MAIVHKLEPVRYDYKQLRVAAYARVSSKSDDQKNSFASQVNYYRNLISTYPNYVFAGIYADEGITGTTIKGKRDDFERMLFDCRHHKIDRILVKSIQRFSRNTVDCISALRELKNCGVSVFFEKEGIDTDIVEGEVLITLLSYFSQCESTNIAKNCRWGFATRAAQGKYKQNKPPLGYDVKNGELVINDEEAKVVMRIFEMRLKDIGSQTIAKILTQEGIKNKAGKASWKQNTISYILQNERYIGDKLLQKRMTTDTLPFRLLKSANQKPQFYIKDTHEGIISKEDFDTVQMMIKKQKETFHNAEIKNKRHLFTSLVVCGECGTNYKYVKNRDIGMYVCQQKDYDKTTCQSCYVKEDTIKQGFVDVYNEGLANKEEILKLEKYAYQDNLNKEKQELTIQLNKAIREKLNLDKELLSTSDKDLEEKRTDVLTTIEHLKQSLKEKDNYVHKMVGAKETEKLQNVFLEYSEPITKFSAGLFHKTIHRIRIENEEMIFIWINKKETRIPINERRAKKKP